MALHALAGKPAPKSILVNIPRLVTAYYANHPDREIAEQGVSFGTSGHRGSSFKGGFNEDHILAVAQAVCDYREAREIRGPLFVGMDTHALSEPCFASTLEVLAANGVLAMIQAGLGYTPTPVISHAILTHNRDGNPGVADGIVITPSHNPPEDGGFKYNPPEGGPADVQATRWIEDRANGYLRNGLKGVRRIVFEKALRADTTRAHDYIGPYVNDLANVLDMERISASGIRIGVDPMGGSSLPYWEPVAHRYGINLDVVNREVDPAFGFMTVDRDGKIRMDCSSPYAMARLIGLKDRYDIAFGNDPDSDRHGIVTRSSGLMNPNHYLAVAIGYLFRNRPGWRPDAAVGKTLVSSSLIDRVADHLGRRLLEVPVGFKWFVGGLLDGSCGFGGEESAGASFLRRDGTVWTTDKDGLIMGLLAAEITATTGRDPGEHYEELAAKFGTPLYERMDVAASAEQRAVLERLSPDQAGISELAGDAVVASFTEAPGNGMPIGGLKIATREGWFAARPSGTENIYKVYTESFRDRSHLARIQEEAQAIIADVFRKAGV